MKQLQGDEKRGGASIANRAADEGFKELRAADKITHPINRAANKAQSR